MGDDKDYHISEDVDEKLDPLIDAGEKLIKGNDYLWIWDAIKGASKWVAKKAGKDSVKELAKDVGKDALKAGARKLAEEGTKGALDAVAGSKEEEEKPKTLKEMREG